MAVDKDLLVVMNTIDDTKNHMSTCDSIKRIHRKLSRPKVVLPGFGVSFPMKMLFAVSMVKVVEGIKKVITR